jgi:hypothetical protein
VENGGKGFRVRLEGPREAGDGQRGAHLGKDTGSATRRIGYAVAGKGATRERRVDWD